MPLRDHFRAPLDDHHSWDEVHGQWPAMIVQQLFPLLPEGFEAAPRIHLGSSFEVDVGTLETAAFHGPKPARPASNGSATALATPPRPSLTVETDLPDQDEYEVRVYDAKRGRRLVAALEIVSPANKDRAEHRAAFVGKCLALLQQRVSVSLVDFVTTRGGNLYTELLTQIGHDDPAFGDAPSSLYAVTCRTRSPNLLDAWAHTLMLGQPLPRLPLWLTDDLMIPLDLESSYEETCKLLRIS